MTKRWLLGLALCLVVLSAAVAQANLSVGAEDTLGTVLGRYVGKSVTLKLDSGDELTGTVRSVGKVVHLEQLGGKEFFDAVVDLDEVAAVVVRAR